MFMASSYIASVVLLALLGRDSTVAPVARPKQLIARIESEFLVPNMTGNPFDYKENDVRVTFKAPGGKTVSVPAFFVQGKTWKVRYRPAVAGDYIETAVTRNGKPVPANRKTTYSVVPDAARPFVRRDPKHSDRLMFANGMPYYPLGHNVAWKSGDTADVPEIFAKMGQARENWSRVWMCHWDGKNLDWLYGKPNTPGTFHPEVAERWDKIVEAAEQNGIYFQLVLQHHGPYSSTVNSNWDENPWNVKNGGFLQKPEEFFTHPRAIALTRAKYRYILARYGHSPAILAWELFNEVEWVDAIRNGKPETVAKWHRDMAEFLRQEDVHGHLVTTSSDRSIPGLYDGMDYVQPHAYPADLVATAFCLPPDTRNRPVFLGEIGPTGDLNADEGASLRACLWSSLMSSVGGAAQYWAWDNVDRRDLYSQFRSATAFVEASGLAGWQQIKSVTLPSTTERPGSIAAGPGQGWSSTKRTEYTVLPSGTIDGIAELPAYFQGENHREMFTRATFIVTMPQAGAFQIRLKQIAKAGAGLTIAVDGKTVVAKTFPPSDSDKNIQDVLEVALSSGQHTVRVENPGTDWVLVERIVFTNAGTSRATLAKIGEDHMALYTYPLDDAPNTSYQGNDTITLPELKPGTYPLVWWDVRNGKPLLTQTVTMTAGKPVTVKIPVAGEVAAYLKK